MNIFGWKLIRESEFKLIREMADMELKMEVARAKVAEEYAAKWERIVNHERERIDSERERADRIADSLFQSSGLPPVSPMVLQEQKEEKHIADLKRDDYAKDMQAIFSETWDDVTGAESEPEVPTDAVEMREILDGEANDARNI